MTPSIVHYTLADYDVATIPAGASELNAPVAGDVYPLLITRTFKDSEAVNGRVFLDGQHDLWVTSRVQGDGPGQWSESDGAPEPAVVPETAAVEDEPEPEAAQVVPEADAEVTAPAEDVAPALDPSPAAESAGPTEAGSDSSTSDEAANAEVPAPEPADPAQLVADSTKVELQAAAADQGVEVPASATKADIAQAIVDDQAKLAADQATLAADQGTLAAEPPAA
jgi:hypothetical protein